MTQGELEAIIKGILPSIRSYIDRRIDERLPLTASSVPTVAFHQISDDERRCYIRQIRGNLHTPLRQSTSFRTNALKGADVDVSGSIDADRNRREHTDHIQC